MDDKTQTLIEISDMYESLSESVGVLLASSRLLSEEIEAISLIRNTLRENKKLLDKFNNFF